MSGTRVLARNRIILATIVSMAVICSSALAQTAGARLEGTVRDSTAAVIPGVTVTATNEGTSISYTSLSNETGFYVFVNLPPGTYTLASELQGFKRFVNKGIGLKIGDNLTMHITLQTGDLTSEVLVSAAAPLIDVTSGKIGSVVQERQVLDLPLNGRNPMMLYYLQAGTNPRDTLGGQQAVGSVDGLRTNANNTRVEGVYASDSSYDMSPAAPNVAVPLESVGEYRVTTSSATAEMGRGAGAQVQVVYRTGTNNFHGSVYEFNRNTVYNANNFFGNRQGAARPVFLRNQYGVAVGGPIRKNRTFFFATWEGQRQVSASIENRLVYTQPLRDGIFRFNTARANSTSDVDKSGNPLVAYKTIEVLKVDATRLGKDSSGRVDALLAKLPLPNNYDIGDGMNLAGYRYTSSNPNHGKQLVVKLDHTLSNKHQLSGAIGGHWFESADAFMFSGYRSFVSAERKRNIAIGLVSAFKSNLTNEFRVGATRRLTYTVPGNPANFDTKGNYQFLGLGSGRGGGTNGNLLGEYLPQRNPIVAYSLNNNMAWVMRNHTFKWGFEVVHSTKNNWFGGDQYIPVISTRNSDYPANVPAQAGLASADRSRAQQLVNDLTGTIGYVNQIYNANSFKLGFVPYDTRHRLLNQREWGVFFQDTWRVAQNLTVNYGMRWDLLPPAYFKNGVSTYPKGGSASVLGVSGPLGIYETDLMKDKGSGIINWDWNNFGPHLGFTWDPSRDGKMSVSAYFRLSYDRHMQSVYSRLEDQNQGMNITLLSTPFVRFSDSNLYQTVAGKSPILPLPAPARPFAPIPFTREGRAYALDENIRSPYTQNWSLRIQRELTRDWFVQIAYVGNTSVGGWRAINHNQIEIRKNGFLDGFLAAQRNLAANGNPNRGESIGVLATVFAPLGGIPSSQNNAISQGQAAALANYADTTVVKGVRGGLLKAAGMSDTFFRVNPQVLNATIADNLSNSTWHGMKLEIGKRFSEGTYFQFNYTLAKGLTDYIGGQGQYDDYRDNLNRKLDKTYQDFDSTHIAQANGIWELPFGQGKRWLAGVNGWKNLVIGGWQINGIFQLATSRPLTITSGRANLTLNDSSTADFSGGDFNLASKVIKGNQVLAITAEEKALFKNPAAGSAGGTPLRAFRGPLYTNVDASLFKNFRAPILGEQGVIQFRAEAFNLFNHANFGQPASNINAGNFGQISNAFAARIFQFAVKVNF